METIKVKEARSVFLTQKGFPRKEILLTVEEVYDACGVQLSENKYEMLYQKRTGQSVLSGVKKFFNRNHINFVAPKVDGRVHYGFTNDRDLIEDYVSRMSEYYKAYGKAHRTAKQLTAGQLELDIEG